MPLSRREILSNLRYGVQLLPALALAPRSVLGDLLFEPDAPLVPAKPVPRDPFQRNGKSPVVLIHGHDVEAMLHRGLEILGGPERLPLRGKRVLLKPNIVNDRPPPTTTSPALIAAGIRMATQAGAAEVIVADSSGVIRFPTADNLAATGIKAMAESLGARVLALEEEPWVRVEPAGAEHLTRFYVSKPVYEADVFLNLPVVKTHRFANYSCSLKNLVGIVHPRNRPSITVLMGHWQERIAELNLAVHPLVTVADATTLMIAGGPTSGTPAKADVLLLSGDRVALDAVAVALIRTYGAWPKVEAGRVWDQRQLKRAAALGLGAGGPEAIEIVTESLAERHEEFDRLTGQILEDLNDVTALGRRAAGARRAG